MQSRGLTPKGLSKMNKTQLLSLLHYNRGGIAAQTSILYPSDSYSLEVLLPFKSRKPGKIEITIKIQT